MNIHIEHFDPDEFLAQYWQQSPLLIRNGVSLDSLIDGDDLAGLAMEIAVESRIIQYEPQKDNWHLKHGPFSEKDFETLPEKNWTLLVQAVDHWVPEVRQVLSAFKFLPQWRIDDIMISYATEGGGVGPHYDQYDVFLIQTQGRREWKTGQLCNDNSDLVDQMPVKVLADFQEQDSWVMEPGDILYLPPALAHWGTALEDSITISVGFRAPAHTEVISDFGHFLSSKVSDFERYSDAQIKNRSSSPHQIQDSDVNRLKEILLTYADSPELLSNWLGQYMTEPKYDDMAVDTGDWTFNEFVDHWKSNPIYRNASSRMAFTDGILFVDGQCFPFTLPPETMNLICDSESFTYNTNESFNHKIFQQCLWSLINVGAVFFDA